MKYLGAICESAKAEAAWLSLREIWNSFWPTALDFLIDLVIALAIFFVGKLVIKWILKLIRMFVDKISADETVENFIVSLMKAALYVILIIIVAGVVGIPTASLIAVISSAGLAIGLALQGSLANLAGGVLILLLKPFRLGDFIDTSYGAGTVTDIDIFYTKLNTGDNRQIVIPNGGLSNSSVINVSKEKTRRIDLVISAGYQDDIRKVKALLQGIVDGLGDKVLADKPADIFINEFAASSVNYTYRIWVKAEDYWTVRAEVMERVKDVFDENGVSIPFSQLDVTIVNK